MSEAQWQAVQRLMAGILPEWTGTDLKQRSAKQRAVVQQLWKMAGTSAELLQEWKVRSAAGNEWLRQREASKGWLQLVLRAWRGGRAPRRSRRPRTATAPATSALGRRRTARSSRAQ